MSSPSEQPSASHETLRSKLAHICSSCTFVHLSVTSYYLFWKCELVIGRVSWSHLVFLLSCVVLMTELGVVATVSILVV